MATTLESLPVDVMANISRFGLTLSDYDSLRNVCTSLRQGGGRNIDKTSHNLVHKIWRQTEMALPSTFHMDPLASCTLLPIKGATSRFYLQMGQHQRVDEEWQVDIDQKTVRRKTSPSSQNQIAGIYTTGKLIASLYGHITILSNEHSGISRLRANFPELKGSAHTFNIHEDKLLLLSSPRLFNNSWRIIVLDLNADRPEIPIMDHPGFRAFESLCQTLIAITKKIAGFILCFFQGIFSAFFSLIPGMIKGTIAATCFIVLPSIISGALTFKAAFICAAIIAAAAIAFSLLIGALAGCALGITYVRRS